MSRSASSSRTPDNGTANPGTSSTRGNSFNRPKVNPPPYLVIDNDSAENWKMWRQMWNNYTIITGLDSQSEQFKTALVLDLTLFASTMVSNLRKMKIGISLVRLSTIEV